MCYLWTNGCTNGFARLFVRLSEFPFFLLVQTTTQQRSSLAFTLLTSLSFCFSPVPTDSSVVSSSAAHSRAVQRCAARLPAVRPAEPDRSLLGAG